MVEQEVGDSMNNKDAPSTVVLHSILKLKYNTCDDMKNLPFVPLHNLRWKLSGLQLQGASNGSEKASIITAKVDTVIIIV